MRWVEKQPEPKTLTETRCATTTVLGNAAGARVAFNQLDKAALRERLAAEQDWLCAFCMRRISETSTDERGEPTMKIAHRTPIGIDSTQALSWTNLLGSCDGGQRSGGRYRTCDAAQGSTALTIDPTTQASIAKLRYEHRSDAQGLFVTSDDLQLRADVDQKPSAEGTYAPGTLALNSGDLPALRGEARKAFQEQCRRQHPNGPYGKEAWRMFFPSWVSRGAKKPEMLGVVEVLVK